MSTEQQTRDEPKRISREDFYTLMGLLTLAREHNAALKTIERAAQEITKEEGFGLTADAVYEGTPVSELLEKLEVEVEEASTDE